jgi:hypothetical protein
MFGTCLRVQSLFECGFAQVVHVILLSVIACECKNRACDVPLGAHLPDVWNLPVCASVITVWCCDRCIIPSIFDVL